jgi:hypothetical protein
LHTLAEAVNRRHELRDGLVLVHLSLQLLALPLYCRAVLI